MGSLWRKSGSIERDQNDVRAAGALAYFYTGGTTTPLAVYQDAAETSPATNPVVADAYGRWPQIFVPYVDNGFDEKIATSGGVQLSYYQSIPNLNPVQAASQTVDTTQLLQTGDWLFSPAGGTRTGFVRANGRTIGSASSGASERANADTQTLYEALWNGFADSLCPVTGGRGASASADFSGNKAIQLIDARGAGPRGVDDMGNSAGSFLGTPSFTTGSATTGGSVCGANSIALVTADLPSHTHTFSTTSGAAGSHSHTGTTDSGGVHGHVVDIPAGQGSHQHTAGANGLGFLTSNSSANVASGGVFGLGGPTQTNFATLPDMSGTAASAGAHTHTFSTSTIGDHLHVVSGTTDAEGSGTAHDSTSRSVLGTWYVKL